MDELRMWRALIDGGGFNVSLKSSNGLLLFSIGEYVVGGSIVIDAVLALGNNE